MENISVLKYSGKREPFDKQKVIDSMLNSGLGKPEAREILAKIEPQLYDGISTKELYKLVYQIIEKTAKRENTYLYRAREILAKIGSFEFEKFVKKILEKQAFSCQYDRLVQGHCITHQIDVIARKQGEVYYVEVKHHKNHHRDTGLGEMCEIWARFEDMSEGFKEKKNKVQFSKPWLFTNTKISEHAKKYAACKGIKYISWKDASEGKTLREMVNELKGNELSQIVRNVSLESNFK